MNSVIKQSTLIAGESVELWSGMRVNGVKHIPENCRAKPCLLVKKSVVNCRLTELKVLWRSGGSVEPLSSLRSTPPSWGPSQIRKTSCTSSVWKTRKCNLWSYTNKHNIRQFRLKKLIVGWKREKERKQSYLQYLAPRGKRSNWNHGVNLYIFTGFYKLYNNNLFYKRYG